MTKKPKTEKEIDPLIKAMAAWAVDDAIAAHKAKLPTRKRLPKEFLEKELAKETPPKKG